MRGYRRVRRKLNDRLLKADREGRLVQELEKIEKRALRWWESAGAAKKTSRRAAR